MMFHCLFDKDNLSKYMNPFFRNDPQTIKELKSLKQEPVSAEDIMAMSCRIGAAAYLECSAKTKEGVRRIFETATQLAISKKKTKKKTCELL